MSIGGQKREIQSVCEAKIIAAIVSLIEVAAHLAPYPHAP